MFTPALTEFIGSTGNVLLDFAIQFIVFALIVVGAMRLIGRLRQNHVPEQAAAITEQESVAAVDDADGVVRLGDLAVAPVIHPHRIGAARCASDRPRHVLVSLVIEVAGGIRVEIERPVAGGLPMRVIDLLPARIDDVKVHVAVHVPGKADLNVACADGNRRGVERGKGADRT